MKDLFRTIVHWILSQSIRTKLGFSTGLFALAICTLTVFFVQVREEAIRSAEDETRGIAMIAPLSEVLTQTVRATAGIDTASSSAFTTALLDLSHLRTQAAEWNLQSQLDSVIANAGLLKVPTTRSHEHLTQSIATLSHLIRTVADTTDLSYDPDPVRFHLMALACDHLVTVAEHEASLIQCFDNYVDNVEERDHLSLSLLQPTTRLNDAIAEAEADMEQVSHFGSLNAQDSTWTQTLRQHVETLRCLIALQDITSLDSADRSGFAEQQKPLIAASIQSSDAIVESCLTRLRDLLEAHSADLCRQRILTLSIAGVLMILPLLITLGIMRSIVRGIRELRAGISKVQDGDYTTHVDLASQDDLGTLATGFNAMIECIRESNQRSQEEQESALRHAEHARQLQTQSEQYGRELSDSVSYLREAMHQFSEGNLCVHVDVQSSDVIGELFKDFNDAVDQLHQVVEKVRESIDSTAKASSHIRRATDEMASGAQEQTLQTVDVAGD